MKVINITYDDSGYGEWKSGAKGKWVTIRGHHLFLKKGESPTKKFKSIITKVSGKKESPKERIFRKKRESEEKKKKPKKPKKPKEEKKEERKPARSKGKSPKERILKKAKELAKKPKEEKKEEEPKKKKTRKTLTLEERKKRKIESQKKGIKKTKELPDREKKIQKLIEETGYERKRAEAEIDKKLETPKGKVIKKVAEIKKKQKMTKKMLENKSRIIKKTNKLKELNKEKKFGLFGELLKMITSYLMSGNKNTSQFANAYIRFRKSKGIDEKRKTKLLSQISSIREEINEYHSKKDFTNEKLKSTNINNKYNTKQLTLGIKIEMEHTNDKKVAETIAKHHLDEYSNYYTELVKMEKKLEKKDFTSDIQVKGHWRINKKTGLKYWVRPSQRGFERVPEEDPFKPKKKTSKIKELKPSMLIQNEDEWAIAHFGSSVPHPTYREYLENEKVRLYSESINIPKGTPERVQLLYEIGEVATKISQLKEKEEFEVELTDEEIDEIFKKKPVTFTSLGLRRKTPEELRSDFIDIKEFNDNTLDFVEQKGDFTIMHGPITRDGPFEYEKNGKSVIYYKDWDNIKDVFKNLDYIPLKASIKQGSHHAKILGYATNFKPNNKTRQMFSDVVLFNDINELTTLLDDGTKYAVSIGFKDHIENSIQIIDYVDHIALSLLNVDTDRCSTLNGKSCYAKQKKLIK